MWKDTALGEIKEHYGGKRSRTWRAYCAYMIPEGKRTYITAGNQYHSADCSGLANCSGGACNGWVIHGIHDSYIWS